MEHRPRGVRPAAARPNRACRILAGLFALMLGAAALASVPVRRLDWTFVAPDPMAATQPAAPDAGTAFDLPLRWSTEEDAPLRTVQLRAHFTLAQAPQQPWALLLTHATEGGRFVLNGQYLGTIGAESAVRHVAWHRPQLLPVDPPMLVAGDNELLIETTYGAGLHGLAGIEAGPMPELWNRYAVAFFLDTIWTWLGTTIALLAAAICAALWLQRRDAVSLPAAGAALGWACLCATTLVEIAPQELSGLVRFGAVASNALFSACLAITLMRLCGLSRRREEWLLCAYAALGPLASLVGALHASAYLPFSWQPGLVLIIGAATGVGLYRRTQGLESPHPATLVVAVLFVFAELLDLAARTGLIGAATPSAAGFAGPLMIIALTAPLLTALARLADGAESARAELETRVREREQLLKRNFERLRESERGKAEVQERQRIMQDMHDGLGSQLMSSLMLVERGAVSNDQFAQILRESIDDMRLAIDALTAESADLAAALGNLRFRMEPRLRAAGIELAWDARNLPEEMGLHPDVVLPILRVVQEALTNALRHSRARAVRVTLGTEGSGEAQVLDVRIADNGRGIAEERAGGRGLLNMRNRAQKIGAQLRIETTAGAGTTVHLRTRIGNLAHDTRGQQTVLNTQAVIERARQQ